MKRLTVILALAIIIIVIWTGPAYAQPLPPSLGGIFSTPQKEQTMLSAQDVLNVARSLIGVHETPDGSNIAHPITDWAAQYGYSTGDAWCSWTVSYEFYHVGGGPALIYNHPSGYSGDFRTMGEKYGLLIPGPRPGAIDVMDFDGKPDFTDHVGIVESVNSDGSWVNIEGNHSNQVMRVTRRPGGGSHWFVLPKYITTPAKPRSDDSMYYAGPPYASADGKSFIFPDCYNSKHVYCLHTFGAAKNLIFKLVAEDGTTHVTAAQTIDGHHLHFLDILAAQKPTKGSFELIATSDTAIRWGLREELR